MDDILVKEINSALGKRKDHLTEDQYQIFWIGVLSAIPQIDKNRNPIPFLILRGLGEVKNSKRSHNSYEYYKICPVCGSTFGFRPNYCNKCGTHLDINGRHNEFDENNHVSSKASFDGVIDKVMFEQFINTLEGKQEYVAKRWMVDRADLYYDNHLKQISFELDCSPQAVNNLKKKVKKKFLNWYHG